MWQFLTALELLSGLYTVLSTLSPKTGLSDNDVRLMYTTYILT